MKAEILSVPDHFALPELVAFLEENQITGAPVVDASGDFVGVVSVTDIAGAGRGFGGWEPDDAVVVADRRGLHVEGETRQVKDIMTPAVFTVAENTPASQLASAMISGRVHRLMVSRKGKIVGIVTSLDLLKLLCDPENESEPKRRQSKSSRSVVPRSAPRLGRRSSRPPTRGPVL
jgi:CBS domain-containing protein